MQKIISDAFITTPIFRTQQPSENEKKQPQNLKQKIIEILNSFNDKQILTQAINNIAIPKHFIDIQYIQSRPQQQMPKIYTVITALKKEILKIKNIPTSQSLKITSSLSSLKPSQSNTPRSKQNLITQKSYEYLKKQILPQTKIRQAILQQLMYRQKLQTKTQKIDAASKIKSEFIHKRRETAKIMNKKANQLYQKQKENQQKQFQKIFQSTLQSNNKNDLSSTFIRDFPTLKNTVEKDYNHQMVKQRLQKSKNQFQKYLQKQNYQRIQKEKSLKHFKHRRLNSLNDRILLHKVKSHQVLERKIATANEEQNKKLNNFIHKQIKFLQNKKAPVDQENRNSELTQTHTLNNSNYSNFRMLQTRSVDLQKQNEKQNNIFDKLWRKNELKKLILQQKVQKIRQKNKRNEQRREAFKESQMKFITQSSDINESFVYQNNFLLTKSGNQNKSGQQDGHEQNIKKKHEKILKISECEESILKLRKLPKSALLKKLKEIKNKELTDILAQNIVKLIK